MQDNQDILPILWRWRKHLLISTFAVMIVITALMLFKPNYYKASSLFYPVSESLQKPIVEANDQRLNYYGDDNDVDRILSIAKSTELKEKIISDLSLMKHYEIKETEKKPILKVHKKFQKLYDVAKTQFGAIEVSIEDKDPEKAQIFANRAVELIELKALKIIQSSRDVITQTLTSQIETNNGKLAVLTRKISQLKEEHGIYDTESQAEALATLDFENPNDNNIKERIKEYTKGISEVIQLETQQEELSKILTYDENLLNRLSANQQRKVKALHIIERASLPLEKSRPHRILYILGAGLLTFMFSSLLALFTESIKTLDWTKH